MTRFPLPSLTAVLAVAAAGAAFARAVEPGGVPAGVGVGVLAGVVLALPALRGAAVVAAAGGAALAAAVTAAAVTDGDVLTGLRALRSGWGAVLATTPPAPADADRLPVVAATVAVAVVVAVALARGRRPAAAVLPAVAVLLVALALGAGGPRGAVAALPLVVAVGLHLALLAPAGRRGAAVGVVTVVSAVAAGAGPLLAVGPEADPRALLDPPVDVVAAPAPLAVLPARLAEPDVRLFTATVDRAWLDSPRNWRQVALDVFDGTTWSSSARPQRIGSRVPEEPPPGTDSRSTVVVEQLDGPWVPTSGAPAQVDRVGLAVVPQSSVLLDPAGVAGSYVVRSVLPRLDAAALDRAALPALPADDPAVAVPDCLPDELRAFAADAVAGISGPGRQAVALEQAFTAMTSTPDADPGHSCGRFPALLEDRQGTSEQFASAYALAARSLGLPARVAVGFRPGRVTGSSTTVLSGDAVAWPEVRFAGLGWVPFDPTPREAAEQGLRQELPALTEIRREVAAQPEPVAGAPQEPARVAPAPPEPVSRWRLAGGAAAALVLLLALVRPVRRWLRRRARRRAAPRAAVLGAWQESLDLLGGGASRTPAQLLAAPDLPPGSARPLAAVAALADLAAYGAADPQAGDAERAWAAHDAVRRAVRRHRRRRQLGRPPRTHTGST